MSQRSCGSARLFLDVPFLLLEQLPADEEEDDGEREQRQLVGVQGGMIWHERTHEDQKVFAAVTGEPSTSHKLDDPDQADEDRPCGGLRGNEGGQTAQRHQRKRRNQPDREPLE